MQITLVNYEYPGVTENCGGGGAVTKSLACGLGDRGDNVSIVTDPSDGHYATFPFRSYRRLDRHLGSDGADVLHGHFSLPTSLFLPRLAKKHDVPLIVSVMGGDVYDPSRFSAIRPVMDAANEFIFDEADAVTVLSSDMAERIESKHGHRPQIIPFGLDPADSMSWRERSDPDPLRILTVCRHVPRKNLDIALRAVHALRQCVDVDVEYRLVGTGPLTDELRSEWEDVEDVVFRGFVDDLEAEYDWGDIFVLPSAHESFGIVYLEALAAGLPVVASDCGGQTDFLTDAVSRTVEPTVPNVTHALREIFDDYESFQAATEDYVADNWSVEDTIRGFKDLYRTVT